jgi:hypothetical protein
MPIAGSADADLETRLQSLFGDRGLNVVAPGRLHACVLLSGGGVANVWRRCIAAVSGLPVGGHVVVQINIHETGFARVLRWVVLPLQLALVTLAFEQGRGVVVGRFAVFPDMSRPDILYQLRSAAAVYAERLLIQRTRQFVPRVVRKIMSMWARCDSRVGTILIVGRKT